MHSKTVTVLTPHLRSLMENFVLHYIEVSRHHIICTLVCLILLTAEVI